MQQNSLSIALYIAPDSFVSAYLTVLHVMPENYRWFKFWPHRYALLLPDNTNAEFFRQLRVYLFWGNYQNKMLQLHEIHED